MIAARQLGTRVVPRVATRVAGRRIAQRQQLRFQSSSSTSTSGAGGSTASHFATGVIGGLAGAGLAYSIYSFTPAGQTASKINKAALEANQQYQALAKKLQNNAPDANQAVDSIKQFAYSYAAWVPGGKGYVDAAFRDWETVREAHKEEADKIVGDAYKSLQDLSKRGLSLDTASKAYEVLADMSKRIADLSTDAFSDILDNHPHVKEKFGGSIEKLQDIAKEHGPEAKKQVDETWRQLKDIFAGGFSADNMDKARKLVEDKLQEVQKFGDEAWKKAVETAKPYLDKNPKAKELVEKNADALKQGNLKELFDKVRSAVDSGDTGDLEKYVKSAVDKGKEKASELGSQSGLDKYLQMVPQGGEIFSKLQQMKEVAEKNSDEGEKLLKETIAELKEVLEKKMEKGKKLAEKAKKDAK